MLSISIDLYTPVPDMCHGCPAEHAKWQVDSFSEIPISLTSFCIPVSVSSPTSTKLPVARTVRVTRNKLRALPVSCDLSFSDIENAC